jgi:hypothetical protein
LLDAGADVHADNDGALRWASNNGHLEVVKLLKQYGTRKKVNESIKHLKPRSQEEIEKITFNLSSREKIDEAFRIDNLPLFKIGFYEIENKNLSDFSLEFSFLLLRGSIYAANKIIKFLLDYPDFDKIFMYEKIDEIINYGLFYINYMGYLYDEHYRQMLIMLLDDEHIYSHLHPIKIKECEDIIKKYENMNESKINQNDMKKLNEEEQIYSEAHAKELLQLQVLYNKALQDLNNKLAKQKSDLAVKHMKLAQQTVTQEKTAQKTQVRPLQQQKQTGTVDTTGKPVDAQGNLVQDSYPDILKVKNILSESISTYDTENADETELQSLKDYMDAESIEYKDDENSIEFDDEQLDKEWQEMILDMGLEQTEVSADVKELESEYPEDNDDNTDSNGWKDSDGEWHYGNEEPENLGVEDDNIDLVDVEDQIEENEVFYVKVNDDGKEFVGKIYKLFDEGDFRSKIILGNSETFEKFNYDPDYKESDIMTFLKENYDDVELLSENEFDEILKLSEKNNENLDVKHYKIPTLNEWTNSL